MGQCSALAFPRPWFCAMRVTRSFTTSVLSRALTIFTHNLQRIRAFHNDFDFFFLHTLISVSFFISCEEV